MRIWIAALAVLLASCASTEKKRNEFNAAMESWVGKTTDELVVAKGPPSGSYQLSNGDKVLEYQVRYPESGGGTGVGVSGGVGGASGGGGWIFMPSIVFSPGSHATSGCKVQFVADPNSRIRSWKATGEDCY